MPFVSTNKYYGDHWFELFYRASYESGKSPLQMKELIDKTLSARVEQTSDYHFCYLYTAAGHTFRISSLVDGSEVYTVTEANHWDEIPHEYYYEIEQLLHSVPEYRQAVDIPYFVLRVMAYVEVLQRHKPVSNPVKFDNLPESTRCRLIGNNTFASISPKKSGKYTCYNCGKEITGGCKTLEHVMSCDINDDYGPRRTLNVSVNLPRCKKCHTLYTGDNQNPPMDFMRNLLDKLGIVGKILYLPLMVPLFFLWLPFSIVYNWTIYKRNVELSKAQEIGRTAIEPPFLPKLCNFAYESTPLIHDFKLAGFDKAETPAGTVTADGSPHTQALSSDCRRWHSMSQSEARQKIISICKKHNYTYQF